MRQPVAAEDLSDSGLEQEGVGVAADYSDMDKYGHFDQGGYGIDARDVDTPDQWIPRCHTYEDLGQLGLDEPTSG